MQLKHSCAVLVLGYEPRQRPEVIKTILRFPRTKCIPKYWLNKADGDQDPDYHYSAPIL